MRHVIDRLEVNVLWHNKTMYLTVALLIRWFTTPGVPVIHLEWLFGTLTHWDRDKMAANLQTTFSNAFSWIKMYKLRLRFHWNLFPRVQSTIFSIGSDDYLNQWWLVYGRIYASLGLDEDILIVTIALKIVILSLELTNKAVMRWKDSMKIYRSVKVTVRCIIM